MLVMLDEFERESRRRRYGQLRELMAADEAWDRIEAATAATRTAARGEADMAIQRFLLDQDIAQLRATLDAWSRQNRTFGFAGPNGAMVLNQLADGPLAPESAALLASAIRPPTDPADAEARIGQFIEHARYRREQGSNIAAGRAVPFLSWFWWMADPERWPVLWSSSTFAVLSTQLG